MRASRAVCCAALVAVALLVALAAADPAPRTRARIAPAGAVRQPTRPHASAGDVPPSPGINVNAQELLFPEVAAAITPLIEAALTGAAIPDQSGQIHIPLVGPVDWSITNIDLSSISFADPAVATIPLNGIEFSVTDGSGELNADWKWQRTKRLWKYGDSGSATVDLSEVTLVIEMEITMVKFRPVITLTECDLSLGKMDIHVSTPWTGWIYNMFFWLFNGIIKRTVEHTAEQVITDTVNDVLNPLLQAMPIALPLIDNIEVSHALLANPAMTATDATFGFDGGFYVNNVSSPYVPAPMPNNCTNDMLNVMLSQYVFDSCSFALYSVGLLNVTATPDNVPEKFLPLLNTTSWKPIIPGLPGHYPDQLMTIAVSPNNVPTMNVSSSGLTGSLDADLVFSVLNGSVATPVLTLAMDASLEYDIYFTASNASNTLHVKVSDFKFSLSEKSSSIGRVDTVVITTAIKSFADLVLIPAVNELLNAHGIPLPVVPLFELSDVNFNYFDGYVCVHTSVEFPAPSPAVLDALARVAGRQHAA